MSIVSRDSAPVRPVVKPPAPPKPRKPLAAVAPSWRWLSTPILPANPEDTGWDGLLMIDGKCYLVTPHVAANGTDKPEVLGWRLSQSNGRIYDLDDTFTCDCPDGTFRGERPGGCKHQQALRAALEAIGLCVIVPERPEPRYCPFEGDEPPQLHEASYFDPSDLTAEEI